MRSEHTHRCRSLINESAIRNKRRTPTRSSPRAGADPRRRSASTERRALSSSIDRLHRGGGSGGGGGGSGSRRSKSADRSSALDRSSDRLSRGEHAHAAAPRSHSRSRRAVSRSPSPARFDPTAYVKVREEKLRAARASREAEKRTRGTSTLHVDCATGVLSMQAAPRGPLHTGRVAVLFL